MTEPYRVLARKYRPQRFAELIGQEAMVQTLGNAIARGRIAQAWMLTGVRGVGKTTTARLIAKALNCIGPDGQGGPTITPCDRCEPCRAIAEGRFIDVMEQDAASNTQVDKMRELLDGVPYAPVSGRYKVYVIDEVHMLSTSSFNALLKTLEEPPAHVKFIFATTEAQKVPVTILSRCQRFDLRRVPEERLREHFAAICASESVEVEPEALSIIARAAEGSVRDGLSILDQAIAHGGGAVSAAAVTDMLGLADRGRVRALMSCLLAGDGPGALEGLEEQYRLGVDPREVIRELMDLAHLATRAKLMGTVEPGRPPEERAALKGWAERCGMGQLHRVWQLLLKAHDEVGCAPVPLEAAEMGLLRIAYASSLPDPGELLRRGPDEGEPARPAVATPAPTRTPAPVAHLPEPAAPAARLPLPESFEALVRLAESEGSLMLAAQLHDYVRPVRYAPPEFSFALAANLPGNLAQDLTRALRDWTGSNWRIEIAMTGGEPTLREREQAERRAALEDPAVKALMEAFPGAELLSYDPHSTAAPAARRDIA
ncbi:MAG: DNA polymerase III subunit gamma/tau [Sphingomonadaceae bacterium]|nr:DNA polymerase III subunit gamma/tau [Sphingomonadaceae bacterium]